MAFSQQACVTNFDAFENLYQRSYSHGLEKIYALENVDIRSIRKISAPSTIRIEAHSKKINPSPSKPTPEQLEFPFESPFQLTLPSFILREPIQVLCLNKRIEKCLLDIEKTSIIDLLEGDQQTLLPLKGIGQGHLDEIADKLQSYLEEYSPTEDSPKIEFTSWMKTLVADLEAKKCSVLLEAFQIPALVPLSPGENAEIRKLTNEKRNLWIREATSECCTPLKISQLTDDIQQITDLFLKPWMRKRAGIASFIEVQECLLKLSGFHPYATQILDFMSHVYFKEKFPFTSSLLAVEEELYCDNLETADIYHSLVQTARSYFYKDNLYYPLESLIRWISYEYAKKWQVFSDSFIERTLRLSSFFRVRKNNAGQLIVRLS